MTQTNSDVLRGFMDEVVGQKRLDLLPRYVSENYLGHGTAYVGLGLTYDPGDRDKFTINLVIPGGPAEGKLKAGDQILRVSDGERTWETADELRESGWGMGVLGTSLTIWLLREGVEQEITLERGLVPGYELPYDLLQSGMADWMKDWPELEVRLITVMESSDLVAYHAENKGFNSRYGRSAVWAECGFVRVQDDKITDWWSVEDNFSAFKQLGYTIEEPVAKA